jgi:tetratricopeptide (TPR) repeat protein
VDNVSSALPRKTQETAVTKGVTIKYKDVIALAICAALAATMLSLGWVNPAKGHLSRGDSLVILQQWDEAIAAYTMAVIADPMYVVAYNNRGYAFAQKGHYDKAITDYSKSIEIDPEYARAYNNRGFAYRSLGEISKADADFQMAAWYNP